MKKTSSIGLKCLFAFAFLVAFHSSKAIDLTVSLNVRYSQVNVDINFIDSIGTLPANTGVTFAEKHVISFYLSLDPLLDSGDSLFKNYTVGQIVYPYYSTATGTIYLPIANIPSGNYYIIATTDVTNTVVETNETNNTTSIPISIQREFDIDLTIQAQNSTSNAYPGSQALVSYSISNGGTSYSAYNPINYYLSTDETYDITDIMLGGTSYGYLASNQTVERSANILIPDTVVPGHYYIIVLADPYNTIPERAENNNSAAVSLQVNPPDVDLVIVSTQLSKLSVIAERQFQATTIVKNSGTGNADESTLYFYLSQKNFYDETALFIGGSVIPPLANGESYTSNTLLTAPALITSGNYYVLSIIDQYNTQVELNDANNTAINLIHVTAATRELSFSQLSVSPKNDVTGDSIIATYRVRNSGNSLALYSEIQFLLSTDKTLSSDDISLGSIIVDSINSKQTFNGSLLLTIPTLSAGKYYILGNLDPNNFILEQNENNNTAATSFRVNSNANLRESNDDVSDVITAPGVTMQAGYDIEKDVVNIYLHNLEDDLIQAEIINLQGEVIAARSISVKGNYASIISTTPLKPGIHVLKLYLNKNIVSAKFMVNN